MFNSLYADGQNIIEIQISPLSEQVSGAGAEKIPLNAAVTFTSPAAPDPVQWFIYNSARNGRRRQLFYAIIHVNDAWQRASW